MQSYYTATVVLSRVDVTTVAEQEAAADAARKRFLEEVQANPVHPGYLMKSDREMSPVNQSSATPKIQSVEVFSLTAKADEVTDLTPKIVSLMQSYYPDTEGSLADGMNLPVMRAEKTDTEKANAARMRRGRTSGNSRQA